MKIYCVMAYPEFESLGDFPRVERIFKDEKDAEACLSEIHKASSWPRGSHVCEKELE